MDAITHGLTGALVGKAFISGKHGRVGTAAVTIGAVFPDSDIVFSLFATNQFATLELHRGVTHSYLALPLFAALLAGVTKRFVPQKKFLTLCGLYALGLAIHIFLDLITSWGTMIWSPLTRTRASLDLIFIIDLIFSAIVLFPQVLAWVYEARAGALRRALLVWLLATVFAIGVVDLATELGEVAFPWQPVLLASAAVAAVFFLPRATGWGFRQPRALLCRIGVATLVAYLALCSVSHLFALRHVDEFAAREGLTVERLAALPMPLSPFSWSGLLLTPAGVYQSWFSVLSNTPADFRFYPTAPPNRYVALAQAVPATQTYLWFARFPVVRYRNAGELHIVEYADMRSHSLRNRRSPFRFRVLLNTKGEVLTAGFLRR